MVPAAVLGPHGLGRANANGVALLEHAATHQLKILNSFFSHDLAHTASWTHRRWGTHGVIDLALARQSCFRFVTDCHALPGAEVSSDHKLMILKLRACPHRRPFQNPPALPVAPGPRRKQRLNLVSLLNPGVKRAFAVAAAETVASLDAPTFATLPQALRSAGKQTLGLVTSDCTGWRAGHAQQLSELAQARQAAFDAHRASPDDPARLAALRAARHHSRAVVRRLKADWWQQEMARLEAASRRHDAHVLYGDVKVLGRLFRGKGLHSMPLSSQHSAAAVAAHFHALLNIPRCIAPPVLLAQQRPPFPLQYPPGHWDPPTFEALVAVLKQLPTHKAPDAQGVHAELLRVLDPSWPEARFVLQSFHFAILEFWAGRTPTQELITWWESIMFALFKGKGDRASLENYRGIVLLDTLSKVVSRLLNNRLTWLIEQVCTETENGYRRSRSTSDSVFLVRRLIEAWRASKPSTPAGDSNLFLLFVDLQKAFDSVPREDLFRLLAARYSFPEHVTYMLRALHLRVHTRICLDGLLGPSIPMSSGVRQGSVEGPSLWLLYFNIFLTDFRARCNELLEGSFGVPWLTNRDCVLRTPSKVRGAAATRTQLCDSVFADDSVFFDTQWSRFCTLAGLLDDTLDDYGSTLSLAKTEWMLIPSVNSLSDAAPLPGTFVLRIRDHGLPRTALFRYLGSYIGSDSSLGTDFDVTKRIGLAHGAFNHLDHAWSSSQLSRRTKAKMLLACIAPVLLYGSEHWSLTAARVRKLSSTWMSFVRRCLRLNSRAAWEQHTSHAALLQALGVPSLLTLLQRRLGSWLGHLARMGPDRMPHAVLVGVPAFRTFVKFKGVIFMSRAKALLQHLPGIDDRIWATQAQDRAGWSASIRRLSIVPQTRRTAVADRHRLQPSRVRSAAVVAADPMQCPSCPHRARSAQGLARHISQVHPTGDAVWTCEHCQKAFGRKGALTTHLETCPEAHRNAGEDGPVPAPPRSSARTLAARPHTCPHDGCDLDFPTLSALNRHVRTQCLAREGSGATRQADGRFAFRCPHPACVASDTLYFSTRSLATHKQRAHG